MNIKVVTAILALIVVIVGLSCAYTVDETEQVVITLFSKVNRVVLEPGLHFKIPFFENAISYPKNLQAWNGEPGQVPTKDKTYIWVDPFARWKIVNPVRFFESIGTDARLATNRLNEIIDPAVRNLITSNPLIEAVRNTNREMDIFEIGMEDIRKDKPISYTISVGRNQIDDMILDQARNKLESFGIELVDVKIKRIDYVEEVRQSVYGRMIAERKQIAEKFRSEGLGEAQKIRGDKERDLKQIESEAYRKAQEIKGKADAEATRLYAQAFGADPEFYSFTRTLEIYGESLDKESSLVFSTNSDMFKYLKDYSDAK
ncbi:MAG: protease modulator HflC [Desulfatitalea sp.]